MPKSLSAADMMGRTQRVDAAPTPLVTVSPSRLDDQDSSRLDEDISPTPPDQVFHSSADTVPRSHSDQATRAHGPQATSNPVVERYEKISAFVTPDQRRWLRSTARRLPIGLSGSDIVRLALDQLRDAVDDGSPLVETLTSRAYADAERFEGRRNRGMPSRG